MTDDALMTWLGPAADELTPEQIERIADAGRDIRQRYPDPDEYREREVALSATVQHLLGETSPEDARRELAAARLRAHEAYVTALQIAVMTVDDRRRAGLAGRALDKKGAAEACGIDRMGLLKALGER
jgi:hypothetical protein